MGMKDIALKDFESINEIFADIINAIIYKGEQVVHPEQLDQGATFSTYYGDKGIRSQDRDVVKYWNRNFIRVASFGLENESVSEYGMPYRVMGYDAASYRDQIRVFSDENGKRHKKIFRYPVVTLVLHMDYKKKWNKPKSIHEMLGSNIDRRLRKYVHDYPINVIDVAFLADTEVRRFRSDFRIIADYLVQMRKTGDYNPSAMSIAHVEKFLNMMSALTDDDRFKDVIRLMEDEEVKNMCVVLDKVENRGLERGRREGKEEGRREGKEEGKKEGGDTRQQEMSDMLCYMFDHGRDEEAKRAFKDKKLMNRLLRDFRTGKL